MGAWELLTWSLGGHRRDRYRRRRSWAGCLWRRRQFEWSRGWGLRLWRLWRAEEGWRRGRRRVRQRRRTGLLKGRRRHGCTQTATQHKGYARTLHCNDNIHRLTYRQISGLDWTHESVSLILLSTKAVRWIRCIIRASAILLHREQRRLRRCARSGSGTELGVSSSVFGTSDSFSGTSDSFSAGALGASSFGGSTFFVGSAWGLESSCVSLGTRRPSTAKPDGHMLQWQRVADKTPCRSSASCNVFVGIQQPWETT